MRQIFSNTINTNIFTNKIQNLLYLHNLRANFNNGIEVEYRSFDCFALRMTALQILAYKVVDIGDVTLRKFFSNTISTNIFTNKIQNLLYLHNLRANFNNGIEEEQRSFDCFALRMTVLQIVAYKVVDIDDVTLRNFFSNTILKNIFIK